RLDAFAQMLDELTTEQSLSTCSRAGPLGAQRGEVASTCGNVLVEIGPCCGQGSPHPAEGRPNRLRAGRPMKRSDGANGMAVVRQGRLPTADPPPNGAGSPPRPRRGSSLAGSWGGAWPAWSFPRR